MNLEPRQSTHAAAPDHRLLVGLPLIDAEHAAMFAQLDRLIVDTPEHWVPEMLSEILSQLGRQIDAHFASEERILHSCGMPADEIAEHLAAHEEILEQYTQLNLDLMGGCPLGHHSILHLVRGWIVGHIVEYDLLMKNYLPATG